MASEKTTQILEEIKALTILELNDLVKAIEEEFGVSAAPVAAVAVAGAAAPVAEEVSVSLTGVEETDTVKVMFWSEYEPIVDSIVAGKKPVKVLYIGDEAALGGAEYIDEFAEDDNWQVMEEFCQLMGHREDIWYATNIQIIDYMEVLKHLRFSGDAETVYNPSAQSAWLQVDEDRIVEVPGGMLIHLEV